jgi:hypothetical protein
LGEDLKEYEKLLDGVFAALKPGDFLEEGWTQEYVYYTWDMQRWRRATNSVESRATKEDLNTELCEVMGEVKGGLLWDKYLKGDPDAVEEVPQLLAALGLSMDDMQAKALCDKFEDIERMNRIISNFEGRRAATLRELKQHGETFAENLQRKTDEIVEAEFEDVSPQSGKAVATLPREVGAVVTPQDNSVTPPVEATAAVPPVTEEADSSLLAQLLDAANRNVQRSFNADVTPIKKLIAEGCDLELDVLPAVRETVARAGQPAIPSWSLWWWLKAIQDRKAAKTSTHRGPA